MTLRRLVWRVYLAFTVFAVAMGYLQAMGVIGR